MFEVVPAGSVGIAFDENIRLRINGAEFWQMVQA